MATAIKTADPWAFILFLTSSLGVLRSTIFVLEMLQKTTAFASAATAILNVLTERWWLIPLALAAAGVIYSASMSMQRGGLVRETGWKYLHEGELVVPKSEVSSFTSNSYGPFNSLTNNRFGPFTMVVNEAPAAPVAAMKEWARKEVNMQQDVGAYISEWSRRQASALRRGGGL